MKKNLYRAWKFVHPDLEANEEFAGLTISPTGGIGMNEDRDSVRQAILLLLSTIPGERVMRPDYGCELFRLIFLPNDATTAGLAIHYVKQALERWEKRIEVIFLDAAADAIDGTRLSIILEYRLRMTQVADSLTVSLDLAGGNS